MFRILLGIHFCLQILKILRHLAGKRDRESRLVEKNYFIPRKKLFSSVFIYILRYCKVEIEYLLHVVDDKTFPAGQKL